MKLPKLYSRNKDGSIQEWQVEVQGDKYRMIAGRLNGQLVESNWTVAKGKNVGRANETSPEEQAKLEAQSKWDKKAKTGYFENIDDVDKLTYVEPMLAKEYKKRVDKIKFPVFVDIKFNGMRQVCTAKGPFTRKGEPIYSAPHTYEALEHLFKKYPNLVLDGELYNHNLRHRLNEIISIVGKKKKETITPLDLEDSRAKIKYYVYDGYGFEKITKDTKLTERRAALKKLLASVPYVVTVESQMALDHDEVMSIYNDHIRNGYEGAMIRLNAGYENGRSANLLKLKPLDDDEFEIVDVVEGDGNRAGMAGKVICKFPDGRTFGANLKGNEATFKEILRNKEKYIGKVFTIFYNGFTGLGLPNYAQFDTSNCFKGDR
jgi:DNA ligase 1